MRHPEPPQPGLGTFHQCEGCHTTVTFLDVTGILPRMSSPIALSRRARPLLVALVLSAVLGPLAVMSVPPAAAHGAGTELDAAGLEAMIWCESRSHGRYATSWSSRAPFWGAVQWVQSTWNYASTDAGYSEWSGKAPNQAPPDVQDAVTYNHWSKSSPDQQWPVCHARALERIGTNDPGRYQVCGTDEWSTGPWSRAHPESCPTYAPVEGAAPHAVQQPLAVRDGELLGGPGPVGLDRGAATVLVCDTDGDGVGEAVTVTDGTWSVDLGHDGGTAELSFRYGASSDVALCGDTDGNGTDDPVVIRDGNAWHVRHRWAGGAANASFSFGRAGDIPLLCDTDGDGTDEAVIIRQGLRFVDLDHRGGGAELTAAFGRAGDGHLCGDLDGDGIDDMVVTRQPNAWYIRRTWTSGAAHESRSFGRAGDLYLIG